MVVNQPLKRKGIPKDSDKAASEISGEEKRSEADQLVLEPDGANAYDIRVLLARHGLSPKARRSLVRPNVFGDCNRCPPPAKLNLESEQKTKMPTVMRVAQRIPSIK